MRLPILLDIHLYKSLTMRRSSRVQTNAAKAAKHDEFMRKVAENCSHGLAVFDAGVKGRGVTMKQRFLEGDYVATYLGDLIPYKDAVQRYVLEQTLILDETIHLDKRA